MLARVLKYHVKRLKRFLGPPTALAEQQALGWIAKMTGSKLSLKQEGEFAVWLSLHPSHPKLIDGFIHIWELTGELSDEALQRIAQVSETHQAMPISVSDANPPTASNTEHNIKGNQAGWLARWTQRLRFGYSLPVALSAVLAIALVVASFYAKPKVELYETGTGGYAKIALSDGSILHLNTNTQVRVLYTADARNLQLLNGELFVEVVKDPNRPLTVSTLGFSATAIGTAFGVAATPSQRWVAVAEGEVRVSNQPLASYLAQGNSATAKHQALLAGDKLQLDESFERMPTQVQALASWRGGQLFYRDIELRDLINDLNRYHRQQLVVHDSKLGDIRLSAVLNSDDHLGAVAALSSSLGLESHSLSDNITLLSRKH